MMKRGGENEEMQSLDMARSLILLSHSLQLAKPPKTQKLADVNVFECKTCSRKFPSFQALGGHRASHKRPRLLTGDKPISDQAKFLSLGLSLASSTNYAKRRMHECPICGQEFALGQALGGHMRRHRAAMGDSTAAVSVFPVVPSVPAVLKRSNSCSKRVRVRLDLNLTPLENDLEFIFGKNMAPKVDNRLIL